MNKFDLLYDYEDALERLNRNQSEIDSLRQLVKLCDTIPQTITDKQLLCFLSACNGNEDSVNVMKIYYDLKRSAIEILNNRDPLSAETQQCSANQYYSELATTPEGFTVYYYGLKNSDSSNFFYSEGVKTFFMFLDYSLCTRGPQKGIIIIIDMKHFNMGHLIKYTLKTIQFFMKYVQEALPAKLETIHIFNMSATCRTLLAIMRPFMRSEVLKKIIFHSTSMDYEKFHNEHIPRSCLPSNFGGVLESLDEIVKVQVTEFESLRSHFKSEEEQFK